MFYYVCSLLLASKFYMKREDKFSVVAEVKKQYSSSEYVYLLDFTGVTVAQVSVLRRALAKIASTVVIKNSLNKIAAEGSFVLLKDSFSGQVLTIFAKEPILASKAIIAFTKDSSAKVIGCANKTTFYDQAGVAAFAALPTENEMRAKLIGTINGVAAKLAFIIQLKADDKCAA